MPINPTPPECPPPPVGGDMTLGEWQAQTVWWHDEPAGCVTALLIEARQRPKGFASHVLFGSLGICVFQDDANADLQISVDNRTPAPCGSLRAATIDLFRRLPSCSVFPRKALISVPWRVVFPDDADEAVRAADAVIAEVGKVRLELVPYAALVEEARALDHGNKKDGRTPFNWRESRIKVSDQIGGALRHIGKFNNGEDLDPESLVHHLGLARARLGIALDALAAGTLIDDRVKLPDVKREKETP